MADHRHGNHGASGGGRGRWVLWGFMLIAAYFLITEHRAHVIQYLPFILLLACPLLHLFHGHGGHGGHSERDPRDTDARKADSGSKHGGGGH